MSTTYRDCCGSLRGMVAHQSAGEEPCGWCRGAEAVARIGAEAIPSGMPAVNSLEPVSPERAAVNARVLAAEVEEFERGHGARNVVPLRRAS